MDVPLQVVDYVAAQLGIWDPSCLKTYAGRERPGSSTSGRSRGSASTLTNLGNILRDLGDLAGARERLERALRTFEAVYGPEHPHSRTLGLLNDL